MVIPYWGSVIGDWHIGNALMEFSFWGIPDRQSLIRDPFIWESPIRDPHIRDPRPFGPCALPLPCPAERHAFRDDPVPKRRGRGEKGGDPSRLPYTRPKYYKFKRRTLCTGFLANGPVIVVTDAEILDNSIAHSANAAMKFFLGFLHLYDKLQGGHRPGKPRKSGKSVKKVREI